MSRTKKLTLSHTIEFTPPAEAQAELNLDLSSYSVNEGESTSFNIVRSIRTDQVITVDWTIAGVSVTPLFGTATFNLGEATVNVPVTAGLVDVVENGSITISNPQYVSGPVSAPYLGVQAASSIRVIDSETSPLGFPRMAGYIISGVHAWAVDNAAGDYIRQGIAKLDYVVLGMNTDILPSTTVPGGLMSNRDIINDLKSKNPDILIFDYTDIMEARNYGDRSGSTAEKCYAESGPIGAEAYWS